MKKLVSIAMALALVAVGLVGCAPAEPAAEAPAAEAAAPAAEAPAAAQPAASGEKVTLNIALANNPVSQNLATLAKEYYKADGVELNIAVIPENDLRQKMTTEASSGGTGYDMWYIGPYEASNWARNGWLENLTPYFEGMSQEKKDWYKKDDLFKVMSDSLSLDGNQYAVAFYGEGSFLMYNQDLFAAKGLVMPENPTWDEVYDLACKLNDPANGIVGMTMRGAPGWGMSGAPFVTMINAFGGQFYDTEWNATVDTPEQRKAWEMYKKILRDAGQQDILSYTYNECIALMQSGKCGMYYDATSICGSFEADDSPVKGKIGYVVAPHDQGPSGWMWNWAMGINPNSAHKQEMFDFICWATSEEYTDLTLKLDPTGAATPPAQRISTYSKDAYATVAYSAATVAALNGVDFNNPCVNPVPYVGLQYIAIPEFADAGDKMTEWLAAYVTDQMTLDEAIGNTQKLFEEIAVEGGYKG